MDYKIIRSKRSTIALQVNNDTTLTVKIPYGVSMGYVERFIEEKRNWIEKKQAQYKEVKSKHKPKQFTEGEEFLFAGRAYPLEIVSGSKAKIALTADRKLRITEKCLDAPKHYIEWFYKQFAKKHINERTREIADAFGYKYTSIKINSA